MVKMGVLGAIVKQVYIDADERILGFSVFEGAGLARVFVSKMLLREASGFFTSFY